MKIKYFFLVFLLLFARGCDFYSTSLWIFQENGLDHETNPLASLFGVGWNGLVLVNVIIIGLVIGLSYYYNFKYKPTYNFNQTPKNYKEFISLMYYDAPNSFHKVFYGIPGNKRVWMAHSGYILIRVIIFASFLAAFHNICQHYSLEFYNEYRLIVHRPLYVIYGLIILSMILITRALFIKEFHQYKNQQLEMKN